MTEGGGSGLQETGLREKYRIKEESLRAREYSLGIKEESLRARESRKTVLWAGRRARDRGRRIY